MTTNTSTFKSIILTDLLVNLHSARRPIDARFSQAHLALTGLEIFIKKNSLITLITDPIDDSNERSATEIIHSICGAITEAVGANYLTNATSATPEDIVHIELDCADYQAVVTCLTTLLNREVNYSVVVQLINSHEIHPDAYNLLHSVIPDLMLNGRPLTSVFFINTLTSAQFDKLESSLAEKLISLGFTLNGDCYE
jgi:hypothetical protein